MYQGDSKTTIGVREGCPTCHVVWVHGVGLVPGQLCDLLSPALQVVSRQNRPDEVLAALGRRERELFASRRQLSLGVDVDLLAPVLVQGHRHSLQGRVAAPANIQKLMKFTFDNVVATTVAVIESKKCNSPWAELFGHIRSSLFATVTPQNPRFCLFD